MSYAEITFKDKNPIKRWLQRQRLVSAIELGQLLDQPPRAICDFGGGNGELCKLLVERHPQAKIICYEPTPDLLAEARQNLSGTPGIELCANVATVTPGSLDLVFCLEVFEHLPAEETAAALQTIQSLLRTGGLAVIGVPVEVGIPALYKGAFRMTRRYGGYDANLRNVATSLLFKPPRDRPVAEIAPGIRFHHYHMGFDFRGLRQSLSTLFELRRESASPFAPLGSWLMPEINFVAAKVAGDR